MAHMRSGMLDFSSVADTYCLVLAQLWFVALHAIHHFAVVRVLAGELVRQSVFALPSLRSDLRYLLIR